MHLLRFALVGLWLVGACGGCDVVRDAELLPLSSIEPEWIEPGTRVRIEGEGFPVGRSARVRFEGVVYRPGREPETVDVGAQGTASSAERVVLEVEPGLVHALGGRGTFAGTVHVTFPGADGMGTVSGALSEARLDLAPATSAELSSEVERARRAERWLERMGLSVEGGSRGEGVDIVEVEPGSPAVTAGLRAGDRIVRMDGVHPAAVSDLVPRPTASSVRLAIRRGAHEEPFAVRLPGEVARRASPSPPLSWMAAGLLFILALVGPGARPLARLFRAVEEACARGVHKAALLRAGASLASVAVLSAVVQGTGVSHSGVLCAAYLACTVGAWLLGLPPGGATRGFARVGAALGFVACVATASWLPLADTSTWPAALAHPLALVALVFGLRLGLGAPALQREASGALRSPAAWADRGAQAVAVVALAGAYLTVAPGAGTSEAMALSAGTATLLWGAASVVLRQSDPVPSFAWALVGLVVVPGLALAQAWAEVPAWAVSMWMPGLRAGALVVGVVAVIRGARARLAGIAAPELRFHPFL